MHRQAEFFPVAPRRPGEMGGEGEWIEGVRLLGVPVTAVAVIDSEEHNRRTAAGCGAFTDPALLDLLLGLPLGVPVADPVVWAETADQPSSAVDRDAESITVTRRLAAPLVIEDVMVSPRPGQELSAVQDASLFARFARRWVMTAGLHWPEAIVLEAKLCGVGLVDQSGELLASEPPMAQEADAWEWMLREKVYRAWLSRSSRGHAPAIPARATDEASATRAG